MSHFSNEALKLAIAFRMPLGNGPDRVSTQFCSMQVSCVSIFPTMFMSSSVGVGSVAVGGSVARVRAMQSGYDP